MYNTNNPVDPNGSTDPRDLSDNAQVLDLLLNSNQIEVVGRRGNKLKGIAALQAIITSLDLGSFTFSDTTSGLSGTTDGQFFRVPQGSGSTISFIYYKNENGTAMEVAKTPGDISKLIDQEDKLAGLLTSIEVINQIIFSTEGSLNDIEDKFTGLLTGLESLSNEMISLLALMPSDDERLNLLLLASEVAKTLEALDGFDPKVGAGGGGGAVSALSTGQYALSPPTSLVKVNINVPSIPNSKSDPEVKGSVSVSVDGSMINLFCLISVQGNTSADYAKKNLNIEFYPDANYTDTVDVKIGDLLPHDEWIFKANWIDYTQIRNLMSYQLWDRFVSSRSGYPKAEVDNSYIGKKGIDAVPNGALGHPNGYPCVLTVNGEFYGLGDLMIGKKYKNYNLPKNNPTQIQIDCGQWFDLTTFPDPTAYEFKAPKKPTSATNALIADWKKFCALTGTDFTSQLPSRLDKINVIDFILFVQFICATDLISANTIKNVQIVSYTGSKWYFMPYDLDTVYGLWWNGKGLDNDTTKDLFTGSFWQKITTFYSTDINSRYAALRKSGVISVDALYSIATSLSLKYTKELRLLEDAKWDVPSKTFATLEQIFTWSAQRINYLDKKYNFTA